MARELPEWIGKTDDTIPPPRVRLRVFDAHGGKCYLSGVKIRPGDQWDLDHVVALKNGGENRENNLAPALRKEHRKKTAADVKQKAKNERIRKKHLGIQTSKATIAGSKATKWKRKIDGTTVPRD